MPTEVTVTLPDEQLAELEAMAASQGISVDRAINDAISKSVVAWRKGVLSDKRLRDSADWSNRVREHIARKHAQKELPKDFRS